MKLLLRTISLLLVVSCAFSATAFAETDLHANIKKLLSTAMQDFYYHRIEGNESGYVIRRADEGAANVALLTASGALPRSVWQSYIDSTLVYVNSISDFLDACGAEGGNLLFLVVDDYNFDFILLAFYNGTLIYDYVPAE